MKKHKVAPKIITMSEHGMWGRWGNMLIEYAVLKAFAKEQQCELQIPPTWPGNYLFGLKEPPVTIQLPVYQEQYSGSNKCTEPVPPAGNEVVGHDFHGYGQYHTRWWTPERRDVWCGIYPIEPVLRHIEEPVARFIDAGNTHVGIHIRKGDYGRDTFYLTPGKWYLDWLEEWWPKLDHPVLYVATEDPADIEAFAAYDPWHQKRLGISMQDSPYTQLYERSRLRYDRRTHNSIDVDFFPDWWMLTQCEYLVTGNSTFSFTAGMASDYLKHFFRGVLPEGRIVEENLWDTWPMRHERVQDYPHIDGIALKDNPVWHD